MSTSTKIGDRVVVKYFHQSSPRYLGKVVEINGGIVSVSTPHGSIIKSGFCWVLTPSEEDLVRFRELEMDAENKGVLYDYDNSKNIGGC